MNELRIGNALKISSVTLIPVEQITISGEINRKASWWYGSKELYALVISTSSGLRVLDKNAHELDISELIGNLPELSEILFSSAVRSAK